MSDAMEASQSETDLTKSLEISLLHFHLSDFLLLFLHPFLRHTSSRFFLAVPSLITSCIFSHPIPSIEREEGAVN